MKNRQCNFCTELSQAKYDFKTLYGYWAYGCERHFVLHRMFSDLGTGKASLLQDLPNG